MSEDAGLKILVVDDSPIYRELVAQSLSANEHAVVFAKNGQEAINLLGQQPSIVITDWLMPDTTGLELCVRIRRECQPRYVYVILLTSNTSKEEVIQGLAAGADDYLTKPFHSGELLARVAVGCRIVRLHQQVQAQNRLLEELALTDSLTGMPNRRALETWTVREMSASVRHGFPIWFALADLDRFKNINDSYGHDAGDAVLKLFAEILKRNTRQADISGRLGGEEFVVLLSHIEKEDAAIAVERIRKQFEEKRLVFGGHTIAATVSFGIAGFKGTEPDFSALLARADTALYAAKHSGRNQINFAQPI